MDDETIIIDGYNLLYYWYPTKIKQVALEELRKEITNKLVEYQKFTGKKVILVFDAYKVKGNIKAEKIHGIKIIYTKHGETADTLIERMVKNMTDAKKNVSVVTSDYVQQQFVLGKGAIRRSSREFIYELESLKKNIDKKIQQISDDNLGNTIGDRISKNTMQALKRRFEN